MRDSVHWLVGECEMFVTIIVMMVLGGLAVGGLYIGVVVARVVADQFDELMPQRMIDYSGFVDCGSARD